MTNAGAMEYDDYGYEPAAPTVFSASNGGRGGDVDVHDVEDDDDSTDVVDDDNGNDADNGFGGDIYEPHAPNHASSQTDGASARRGSMSELEEQRRRASIKAIMADMTITPLERRRSIQFLMDGRRNSMGATSCGGLNGQGVAHHSNGSGSGGGGKGNCGPNPSMTAHELAQFAIRTVKEQTSGSIKKSHPYTASTTPVPAIAAGAADPRNHRLLLSSSSSLSLSGGSSSSNATATELMPSKRAELSRPACEHYRRNCTIVAPCCGAAFGCRICHDDCPVLPPILWEEGVLDSGFGQGGGGGGGGKGGGRGRGIAQRSSSMPASFTEFNEPQHHNINRFAIREVICRRCYTRQSSKTNDCVNCRVRFGEYHCAICNLWMDNAERPYHCADCGFCRVGGAENFRHCHDCGMCIDANLFREHNCKVGKYMQNCPVCQEDLFSSRSASHEMPCGHAIHWHCFRELAAHDSRCPVCKKTAETHERMAPTWNAMAMGIELQPVPPDLAKVVAIICNDCEKRDANRSWHFLGVQCRKCSSFNTVVERIQMVGAEAHEFLEMHDPHPASPEGRRRSLAERRLQEAMEARAQAYPDEEMPLPEGEPTSRRPQQQQRQQQQQQQQRQRQYQQQQQRQQQQSRSDTIAEAQVRALRRIRQQEQEEHERRRREQQSSAAHAASLPPREAQIYDQEQQMRDLYRQQMRREEAMRQALLEEQRQRRREQQREAQRLQLQYQMQQQQQQQHHQSYAQQYQLQEHQHTQQPAPQQRSSRARFMRRNSSAGIANGGWGWMGIGGVGQGHLRRVGSGSRHNQQQQQDNQQANDNDNRMQH